MKERLYSYDVFRWILTIWMIIFHLFLNLSSFNIGIFYYYWIPVGFMVFFWLIVGQFLSKKSKKIIFLSLKLLWIFFLLNSKNIFDNLNSEIFTNLIIWNQEIFSFEILFAMWISLFLIPVFNFLQWKINKFWKYLFILPFLWILILDFTNFYSYNLLFILYWFLWYLIWANLNLDNFYKKINKMNYSRHISIVLLFLSIFISFLLELRIFVIIEVFLLYFLTSSYLWSNKILSFLWKNSLFIYIFHIFLIKWISILLT